MEGRAPREPALSAVEGSSRAGTPGSPPARPDRQRNNHAMAFRRKWVFRYHEETRFFAVLRQFGCRRDNRRFVSRHAQRKREPELCPCSIPADAWADQIRG